MIFIAGVWHLIITVSSLHVAISRFCWPVSVTIITDALRACRWFRSFAHNLPMRVCNYDRVENRAIRRKRPWALKVGSRTSCKKDTQGTKQPLQYFRDRNRDKFLHDQVLFMKRNLDTKLRISLMIGCYPVEDTLTCKLRILHLSTDTNYTITGNLADRWCGSALRIFTVFERKNFRKDPINLWTA